MVKKKIQETLYVLVRRKCIDPVQKYFLATKFDELLVMINH